MEDVYTIGPDGELYHHGTKGMRWGIRRYQNKDGSLTPAGKKRYKSTEEELKAREKVIKNKERVRAMQAKQEAKKAELDAREKALEPEKAPKQKRGLFNKKQSTKQAAPNKKKSISEMTDDELRAETARMNAERDYLNAKQNLANATPKQVSKGQKFMKSVMDAAVPKLTSSAADLVNKWATNKASEILGLNKKEVEDVYTMTKKKAEHLKNKSDIAKYEKELSGGKDATDKYEDAKREAEYWKNVNTAKQQKDQYERNVANDNKPTTPTNNTSKTPDESPSTSKQKVEPSYSVTNWYDNVKNNKVPSKVDKAMEKETDRLLQEIDDAGWDLWEKKYKNS